MIPIARYSIAGSLTIRVVGTKPPSTERIGGCASAIWIAKHSITVMMRAITKASIPRMPRPRRARTMKTSTVVMMAPTRSGSPNSSFSAIAVPMTSARSQAMMPSSAVAQSAMRGIAAKPGAALGEVAPCDKAEPRRPGLQQHRHDAGSEHDGEQAIAIGRTASQIGRPVSRIHIADGDNVTRTRSREQTPRPGRPAAQPQAPCLLRLRVHETRCSMCYILIKCDVCRSLALA